MFLNVIAERTAPTNRPLCTRSLAKIRHRSCQSCIQRQAVEAQNFPNTSVNERIYIHFNNKLVYHVIFQIPGLDVRSARDESTVRTIYRTSTGSGSRPTVLICIHDLATDSSNFSISVAQCTNSWPQNLNCGFLISSMNVMSRPHG